MNENEYIHIELYANGSAMALAVRRGGRLNTKDFITD